MKTIPMLAGLLTASVAFAAQDCAGLARLPLQNATVTNAEEIAPGSLPKMTNLPAFCRVQLVAKPTTDSNIKVEVWLPATAAWNGKFQGVGNGGFAGSLSLENLAEALRHGYATASTDTGHEAGGVDASWALGHPEKTIDFGHRAIHEMTVDAKAVIHAFYGADATRAYFNGCSNGGRQALMEAQRYPADYDGILAGAPANFWTHLMANAILNVQALGASGAYISPKKLPAIQAASAAACDANDGVKDGVIGDPMKCHFDVSVLACKGEESDACLTPSQLEALRTLYAASKAFPGYPPGAEADKGAWDLWITGPSPEHSLMYGFGTQFFKNMQFENAGWDFHTFQPDRDMQATDDKLAAKLNSNNPDLTRFQARGGKLILYHGWNDPAIAAPNTLNYYQSVVAKMGAKPVKRFVRVFMAPGMLHCAGGDGPTDLGQFSLGGDADHNLDAALERWVEKGIAPERVVAVKRAEPGGAISQSRPVCAYPMIAKYKGSGSTDDAENFICGK